MVSRCTGTLLTYALYQLSEKYNICEICRKHKNAHYFEKIGGRKRRPYSYIYCIFLQTGKRAVVKTDHVLVPDMELGNEVVGYMGITSATIVTQERLRCTLSRRRRC